MITSFVRQSVFIMQLHKLKCSIDTEYENSFV